MRPRTSHEEDGEGAELRALTERASLGSIYACVLEHRSTDGATSELQEHFKLAGNQIPLSMLREPVEERAVTPAPTNVGTNQMSIIGGVFPRAAANWLSIDMPTVGVGEAVFPVLTQNAVVGTPAENAVPTGTGIDSDGSTTGSFSAEVLSAVAASGGILLLAGRCGALHEHGHGAPREFRRSPQRQA